MRYSQINEDSSNLYHVTFTKKVPNILKKGLEQLHPSNWLAGGGDKRYNEDAGIFAFEHPIDALNWATKMIYEFSEKVSIIKIKMGDDWSQDPSNDISLRFGKGHSMRSSSNVKANDIIEVYNMESFGTPLSTDLSRDEWLERSSKAMN